MRLAGGGNVPPAGAVLTLWRPTDELQAFLAEGRSVSLYGVTASGKRSGQQPAGAAEITYLHCGFGSSFGGNKILFFDNI